MAIAKVLRYSGVFMLVLSGITTVQAQVYKCTVEGQVVYQAEPCVGKGVSGKEIKIQNTAVGSPAPSVSKVEPTQEKPAQPSPSAPVVPVQESVAKPKTQMEREADMCLQYARETLLDPQSAYYTKPSKEGRKLSMTVHAKNKLGGIVTSPAECEINNGVLDKSWTNIYMKRLGWNERADQLGEKIQ